MTLYEAEHMLGACFSKIPRVISSEKGFMGRHRLTGWFNLRYCFKERPLLGCR